MRAAPVHYTPEIGDSICAEIADGKSLRSVCLMDGMPSKSNVMNWLRKYPDFKATYDLACVERAEAYAEEIIDIADDGSNDWMETNDPDNPGWKFNGEHAQRSKLRLEARKWICAKMKPRKYGEKVEISGEITQRDVSDQPLTDEQWSEQYARPLN
jgi:hypothetical protein